MKVLSTGFESSSSSEAFGKLTASSKFKYPLMHAQGDSLLSLSLGVGKSTCLSLCAEFESELCNELPEQPRAS